MRMLSGGAVMFETRLIGGKRFFWGPPPRGEYGRVFLIKSPSFCQSRDFPGHCNYGTGGVWDLYPLDASARSDLSKDAAGIAGTRGIDNGLPGAASIFYEHATSMIGVSLYLSLIEVDNSGLSPFEDWSRILKHAVDDSSKDVILRLKFDRIAPSHIERFKTEKSLISTDIELEVRPRTHSWIGETQ